MSNNSPRGRNGRIGYITLEATKIKIGTANSNPSDKIKQKMRDSKLGIKNPNYGKPRTESIKIKISKSEKNKIVSQDTKYKMQISASLFWNSEEGKNIAREKRLKQSLPIKNTKIEIALQKELYKRDIKFLTQIAIENTTQSDIFIPDKNIVIFADGCYWHGCTICKIRITNQNYWRNNSDKYITEYLDYCGYKVYRFWEHEINNNVESCINSIKELNKEKVIICQNKRIV